MAMIHGLMTGFVDSVIELCRCQTSLAFGAKLSMSAVADRTT
jgi:hypothetical protein